MLDKQRLGTFVLGGLAGALAGILFAPRSGRELRGSITSRAGEARERGRETYFDARESVQERIAESQERPPRTVEVELIPEETAEPLHGVGPEPVLGFEPPAGPPPPGAPANPPPLRDISRGTPRPAPAAEDTEEIRRRIQETRSRLRARLDASGDRNE